MNYYFKIIEKEKMIGFELGHQSSHLISRLADFIIQPPIKGLGNRAIPIG